MSLRGDKMRWLVLAVVFVAAGCAGSAAPSQRGGVATPFTTGRVPSAVIATYPPNAGGGTSTVSLKQPVSISCDGVPCEGISVEGVKFAKSYKDSYGDTVKPEQKGRVFMAVQVAYRATGSGATYNPLDWAAYVDDLVSEATFPGAGPQPQLDSGDLANGKKASGWVFFEVAPTGRIVVAYQPSGDALFEVVTRPK